jgi:hypothetical protein
LPVNGQLHLAQRFAIDRGRQNEDGRYVTGDITGDITKVENDTTAR